MERIKCIAWDFDGVLNKGIENGRYVWQDGLGQAFGIDQKEFARFVFGDGFWPVMRGETDVLDHLEDWKANSGYGGDVQEILQYWFVEDAKPCADMLQLVGQLHGVGIQQVIATNNETRRSSYIEDEMGFGEIVGPIFSSGRMKVAKPDAGYFRHIEAELGLAPEQILFVDDFVENTEAAAACGWQVHHFPENGHAALAERLAVVLG